MRRSWRRDRRRVGGREGGDQPEEGEGGDMERSLHRDAVVIKAPSRRWRGG